MRRIDLLVQTLLILIAIPFAFDWIVYNDGTGFLLIQFLVGAWQLASCFFSLLFSDFKDKRPQHLHMISSLIVILFWIVSTSIPRGWFATSLLFGLPWMLAFYYYSISWRIAFPRYRSKSKFLPHINF